MASAFRDKQGWIADFRGYNEPGKKRTRIRVPKKFLILDEELSAKSFSAECEKYCRYIEINPSDFDAIEHAWKLGAIKDDVRAALLGGKPIQESPWGELTILNAALEHPTVAYERENNDREYLRHRRELDEFMKHSGIDLVSLVSLSAVQHYVMWLKRNGYTFHGIRHRLMYLRCACRVGVNYGIPDALSGWKLNRQDAPHEIETWGLDELLDLVSNAPDDRMRSAILLGGFMGLRSSEIFRLMSDDIDGQVLHVGRHLSKNLASRRMLPLPATIGRILNMISIKGMYLVRRPKAETGFDPSGFDHWMHPYLGRPPKMLRKAFTTWAVDVLSPRHLESFLGHSSGLVAAVTAKHYLAKARVKDLQPAADQIDKILVETLGGF